MVAAALALRYFDISPFTAVDPPYSSSFHNPISLPFLYKTSLNRVTPWRNKIRRSQQLSPQFQISAVTLALQRQFRLFLFWELRGLSPNFYIHVSVSDLYIPRIGPHIFPQQNM